MDVIQAARELGKAIQADQSYINMSIAQQSNDGDAALQKLIGEFSDMRAKLARETQKGADRDQETVGKMDTELKAKYQAIFENENMKRYSEAKNEFEKLLNFVNQIIGGSANGSDPDLIEYQESCGGDCSGCSGCS